MPPMFKTLTAFSLRFGREVRSKVRGKLFLRTSKASWMACGTVASPLPQLWRDLL
jgi:hypothetical protein